MTKEALQEAITWARKAYPTLEFEIEKHYGQLCIMMNNTLQFSISSRVYESDYQTQIQRAARSMVTGLRHTANKLESECNAVRAGI